MAKWTKRNNPHTWGKKGGAVARTKTQIVRYTAPRATAPIIIRSSPRSAPKKKHHRRHHGSGGTSQKAMISMALGGAVYGFIEKSFGAQLPTLPVVGRAGTIAIVLHFFGKGRGGIIADAARAAAVIAGYQIGTTGKISGDEVLGSIVPQVSGIAAQV